MPRWTEHQQSVIDHKNNNLLVSAAAGSGKTAVMIEHIFKTVTEGNGSLDRMLVATYTNAAAASMKEKLNQKFDDAILENPDNQLLLRQKQLLERADISTIHAFCIKTLRKYYFRTPLPPDFRIFEQAQKEMLSLAAIKEILEDAAKKYNDGLFPEYKDLLIQFSGSKSDAPLEEIIIDLEYAIESLTHPEKFKKLVIDLYSDQSGTFYKNFISNYVNDLLKSGIKHAEKVMETFSGSPLENDAVKLMSAYIEFFNKIINANDLCEKNEFLVQRLPSVKVKASPLKELLTNNTVLLKNIRSTAKELTDNIETYDLSPLLSSVKGLFMLHENYVQRLEEHMLSEGGTDFTGVLRYMTRLLEENEDIKEDLIKNIDHIYIDEYQDTNSFQEYIISSLSKGNNMFFVGDIKQSIYGFQHARPELFRSKMEKYSSGDEGDKITLMNNFRSYPEILYGVNFIFKNLMQNTDITEINYDADAYLYPSPQPTSAQYDDCLYKDNEKQCANELIITEGDKESEAYAIALKIKELMNMSILRDGVFRPVRYGDIAILGRSTRIGDRFTSIFSQMGIPYSQQEKEKPDNSDTTATVISLLRLLILRRSDIDLVTVLLSSMGGFTPTELGKIRSEVPDGSLFDALKTYSKNDKLIEKIKHFFNLLDELELIEKSMGLADFIEYLTNETGYIYHTAFLPKSSKEQEALKNLIASAYSYSEFSDKGILGFLDYYQNISEPQSSGFTLDENDNNVHFMTIHRSKGLEFPIVIVAGCSEASWVPTNSYSFNENLGFGFKYKTTDEFLVRQEHLSIASKAIKIAQKKLDIAEDLRVLYVALTRAKNKLIISVNGTKKFISEHTIPLSEGVIRNYKTYADYILPLLLFHKNAQPLRDYISDEFFDCSKLLTDESDWKIEVNTNIKFSEETKDFLELPEFNEKDFLEKVEENFSWKYPYSSATLQRTKHSPSKKQIRTKIPLRKPMFSDKEFKGAQKGTVVHFFMEHVSFYSTDSVQKQADDMLSAGILSKAEYDALPIDQIEQFMVSPFKERMAKSELICRERSFCHIIPFDETGDETLVQGIIDCYFFEGDDIILLDYKTDVINDNLDEHILHHTPQLKMYKAALEELYPGKNVRPYIHFFHVNQTVEIL